VAEFVFLFYVETPGPMPSSRAKSKEAPSLKLTSTYRKTKLISVPILICINLFSYLLACVAKSYAMSVLFHFFTTYSCQVIFNIILPRMCTFHNDFWRSRACVTDSFFKYLLQTIPWILQSKFYMHVLFSHTRHISCLSGTSFNNLRDEGLLRIAWRQRDGPR